MSEIKLTKRGQAIANKAKKDKKSWNYTDYCKDYEKKLDAHKKSHKVSRFFKQLCTVALPTVSEKICNLFKRSQGESKISPAA